MSQRIVIDPVTRIEGHAKITIELGDDGQVTDARFHVAEFRGFERFCVGRPLWEMAGITARVCGICPVSHLIASAKTGDQIMAVSPPPGAIKLRRLMNLAQIVQSHSLSFFHLSCPDLILGFDSDPARRNLVGLIAADREFARGGIRLRQFGQEIIEHLGGKKIHPDWSVPGGVRGPLSESGREAIRAESPSRSRSHSMRSAASRACSIATVKKPSPSGSSPHSFWAWSATTVPGSTTTASSVWVTQQAGSSPMISTRQRYMDWIGEAAQHDSYLKFPYYKPLGYPEGIYRVGPLARLNLCERMPTAAGRPRAARIPRPVRHRDILLSLPLRQADRDPGRSRGDRAGHRRPRRLLRAAARPRRGQPARRRRRQRSASGNAVSSLSGRRERPDETSELDHRHRPERPGHEPDRQADRPALHQGPGRFPRESSIAWRPASAHSTRA